MESLDKNKIRDYVALKSPKEIKGLLIMALIISFMFPVMILGFGIRINVNVFKTKWVIFYILYGVLIIWNISIRINIYKKQVQFLLFNSVLSLVSALEFLSFFYFLGNYVAEISPMYLTLALLGVGVIIASIFYYRIKVYKGLAKVRSGSPNYGVIIGIVLVGSVILRGFLSNGSQDLNTIFISIICLVVGCGMAVGITSIHQYYIARKFKDVIILFENQR